MLRHSAMESVLLVEISVQAVLRHLANKEAGTKFRLKKPGVHLLERVMGGGGGGDFLGPIF